jgi:hypothetical protein
MLAGRGQAGSPLGGEDRAGCIDASSLLLMRRCVSKASSFDEVWAPRDSPQSRPRRTDDRQPNLHPSDPSTVIMAPLPTLTANAATLGAERYGMTPKQNGALASSHRDADSRPCDRRRTVDTDRPRERGTCHLIRSRMQTPHVHIRLWLGLIFGLGSEDVHGRP